jgi:hypothetical protein
MTQAVLRLFPFAECQAAEHSTTGDPQLLAMLKCAAYNVSVMPFAPCFRCSAPLHGAASYVSLMTSEDGEPVPTWLAAICVDCGAKHSLHHLGSYTEGFARMLFGEVAGHG